MTNSFTKDVLPPGITKNNGKFRVTKTFLTKNYSFGTFARLYDAKCVNKNVDTIIAFAREQNGGLINENISLKSRISDLEKKIKLMELWSLNTNNQLEASEKECELLRKETLSYSQKMAEQSYEISRLKSRDLWQRIWNS